MVGNGAFIRCAFWNLDMPIPRLCRPLGRSILLVAVAALAACATRTPSADLERSAALAAPRRPSPATVGWNGNEPLTESLAIATALETNTRVRAALVRVAQRRAEVNQATVPPNPSVLLGVGIAVDGLSGAPIIVQVMQQFSWLWTRDHAISIANAARREAILLAADDVVTLGANVATAHTLALGAEAHLALDEAYFDAATATAHLTERLVEHGEASQLDLEDDSQRAAEAFATLAQARHQLHRAKLDLLAAMGVPSEDATFELVGALARDRPVPDEAELTHRAAVVRLDIAAAREGVARALAEAGRAETKRYPTLGVGLGWQESFADRRAVVPSVTVGVPIFDDGSSAVDVADAKVRLAAIALEATQRAAIIETRLAFQAWNESAEQVALYTTTVLAPALHAQELRARSYAEGTASRKQLLASTRRLINAKQILLLHTTNAAVHRVALERAVGGSFDLPLEPPTAEESNS
jgi:outer membrane protein TolC